MKRNQTPRSIVLGVFTVLLLSTCAIAVRAPTALASSEANGWTIARPPNPTGNWFAVDFAAGQWVALGNTGEVAVSPNGEDWTEYQVPTGSWHSLTYGNGQFVALSSVSSASEEMVSTNGVNWSAVTGPSGPWTGLTFGLGRFVAVSSSGQIVTSTNGLNWTLEWSHSNYNLTSVTYGAGRFVAADATNGALVTSRSGSAWSRYLFSTSGLEWGSIVYGNGNFVALSGTDSGYVATSVFGYVWTLHQNSQVKSIDAATFGCGEFVATDESTIAEGNFLKSTTGAAWSPAADPITPASGWTAVAYGNHRFVAVDSAGSIAWSRSNPDCDAVIPTAPLQVSGNINNDVVWTYMHPSSNPGGAPITGYRVTISNGSDSKQCSAAVYFQPNCIIRGLSEHQVYWVTAQARNRFGLSVTTDPIFVIPVRSWSFSATTASPVIAETAPVVVQVTGIVANSQGVYPSSIVTVHFGTSIFYCRANPFGECLITVPDPIVGRTPIYATYTGYGKSYRSPTSRVTITG